MKEKTECVWTFNAIKTNNYARFGGIECNMPDILIFRMCQKCGRLEMRKVYYIWSDEENSFLAVYAEWATGRDPHSNLEADNEPYCDPILSEEEIEELESRRS